MKRTESRAELRVPMSRKATLSFGGGSVACLIQDFSSTGFFIVCNRPLPIGQVVELRCELDAEKYLQCKIEIKHGKDSCFGTRIVEINESGKALCQQFLVEYYSKNLNRIGWNI